MGADPRQEVLYLLLPMPLKPALRRATLLVSGMDETGTNLAGEQFFTLTDTDSVGSQPYQNQTDGEVAVEQIAQRRDIVAPS